MPAISADLPFAAQPRAEGEVRLATKTRADQSVIGDFFQTGALKCLFPAPRSRALDAVLLNTAGGVTGGDTLRCDIRVSGDTELTMTTQACERAYRAQPGQTGRVSTSAQVEAGGRLAWLPQETILYDGSALARSLTVDLAEGASLVMVEPLIFGRRAMGETLRDARFFDRIDIRRRGVPLYRDETRMQGDLTAHLARPFVANGAGAMASVALVEPRAETMLAPVRALLPDTAGASLIAPDVLVCRILARDSFELRACLMPVLDLLRAGELPRCWMI